jgi:hypothetical protein
MSVPWMLFKRMSGKSFRPRQPSIFLGSELMSTILANQICAILGIHRCTVGGGMPVAHSLTPSLKISTPQRQAPYMSRCI